MAAGVSSFLAVPVLAASGGSTDATLRADDIPVAHTPKVPGGYGRTFPEPVLKRCGEPLVAGAPDLRGVWRIVEVNGRAPAPGERMHGYVERIEQCGNRIVDMGGGTIADARADGMNHC